jgi:hypothetical protein
MPTRYAAAFFFCVGLGFGMAWAALSTPGFKLKVFPYACQSPCTLRVTVQVDPQEDNRQYIVTVDGPNYNSSSTVQLDGAESAYTQPYLWFKDLPAGHYDVDAYLQTSLRTVAHATQQVEIQ